MTFLAPEIVQILATEEYYEAIYIMPPIAAGVFLTCVSNMYTNVLIYYKKTQYIMLAAIIAALSNVILNFIFIRKYGYMAAAYTTLFAYIILSAGQGICARMVCDKVRGKQNTVYNDNAIALMALITIIISLSGLVFYENRLLRYIAVAIELLVTIFLVTKVLQRWKEKKR